MGEAARPRRVLVKRHGPITRAAHWVNAVVLLIMVMSGLQIWNAHPAMYWGQKSTFATPWFSVSKQEIGGEARGITTLGSLRFDTTGVLGWSGKPGAREQRGFPAWATIPSWRSLADGRRWHFFFAWIFVINGLIYLVAGLFGGHVRRDLLPTRAQLSPRHIAREIATHARLKFPKGEAARAYNVLQKLSYLTVVLLLAPLMLLTGLAMSPMVNAAAPWLIDLFGGRQGARSVHFLAMWAILLFVVVHVAMVVASGFWNNLRSMVTGKYAIEVEEKGA